MSWIYTQASRVLIWLSLESDDSKEALDFIKPESSPVSIHLIQFIHKVEAIFRLFSGPYWQRLWSCPNWGCQNTI